MSFLVPKVEAGGDDFTQRFLVNFKPIVSIPLGILSGNPIVLAKWKMTKIDASAENAEMYYIDLVMSAELKKIVGGSSTRCQFQSSIDDITFSNVITLTSGGTGSFFLSKSDVSDTFAFSDHKFWRLILFNGAVDGVGEIRNMKTFVEFQSPENYTNAERTL